MAEELGSSIRYGLGKPILLMRHQRLEHSSNSTVRIFAVGYRATLLSGAIKLSSMHTESLWIPVNGFDPKRYFEGGWLEGVEEYLKLRGR